MLTRDQEKYILDHAYVPEHTVGLMTSLSGGEGFLVDDFFFCRRNDWVIFVGYPLRQTFTLEQFEAVLEKVKNDFKPARISLIAPQLPAPFNSTCRQRDSDYYYTLVTAPPVLGDAVRRNLKKAARMVSVERGSRMGDAHQELMDEFVALVKPPDRVKDLLHKMPRYIAEAPSAWVLNAWYTKNVLAAFYVVDLAAGQFANYIIGCYSKRNYVRGASDLLASELLAMGSESGKNYIHMGLGINDGIRRFKAKWGAQPTRPYEMCELVFKKPLLTTFFKSIMRAYK
ncbi:MAG: hypothetical protein JRH12_15870 [Deltaproteobacteria bacterium]|jgi:hypothetical protein|nr:hypothetical protein [Deltaproteobacteria bacterium]